MEKTSSLPSLINKSRRGVIPSIRYNNALYRVSNTIIVSNTSSTMRGDAVSIHERINTQSPALLSSIKIAYPMSCGIIDERVKLRVNTRTITFYVRGVSGKTHPGGYRYLWHLRQTVLSLPTREYDN